MANEARTASVARKTAETDIELSLSLDGEGRADVNTGIGFLDHMLTLFARHGKIDLNVRAIGDLAVDDHHTVEDVGIALGRAIRQAVGDGSGIERYGHAFVPMDEALVLCALDISGRGMSTLDLDVRMERIGGLSVEMVPEFMRALASNAGITLHIRLLTGANGHHIIEAAFKALGRALRQAVARTGGDAIPSTKGVLFE